jgi:DNA/RNA-binding domain of Phe-tRNA-synthetase-like protein
MLELDSHPLLELHAFETHFPTPLGEMASPAGLVSLLSPAAPAPVQSDDTVRETIRALLRHGGFKPTGRSKPASEYLLKAAQEGRLSSINLAVDACNAVSLHSGLPISVIDVDRAGAPFRVGVAPSGLSYVFNPSGQVMDIGGLLCLFDREGPCANAVKDAERTKTRPETRHTLSLIWSSANLPGHGAAALAWYSSLLESAGATTTIAHLSR